MKHIFNILGIICVACGIIGIIMPLVPTTPFALAASLLFAKSSPRLQRWLIKNRFLGPYLENYYNKTGITLVYKIRTFFFLWIGLMSSIILTEPLWLHFLLGFIGVSVSVHIFMIKTKDKTKNPS